MYREWLQSSPSEEDILAGEIPNDIIQLLLDMTVIRSLLDDSIQDFIGQYPGLEKAETLDMKGANISLNNISFDTDTDLDKPTFAIFPNIKWAGAEFSFPLEMTIEEIKHEENNDGWFYILRDILLTIGGVDYTCGSGAYKTIHRMEQ